MNTIDADLQDFETLRSQYDPWYEFSDDHTVYMRHFKIRRELTYIRARLGLWGQDLTVPVCDLRGQMRYV